MTRAASHSTHNERRGAAAAVMVVSIGVLIGFAALAIDVGVMFDARAELQRSADAAALAAANVVLDENRLKASPNMGEISANALQQAGIMAALNPVQMAAPAVAAADVVVGYLNNPSNLEEPISLNDPNGINTVRVTLRRDDTINGPINLFFASIFGRGTAALSATATATFKDGVTGFRVTSTTGNCGLLPFALKVTAWNNLINRVSPVRDDYTYNQTTKTVSAGGDGIPELNLYPGSGGTQLPPGNFGTVDIGASNNSSADIERQIRYGVSASDLAYFGGELKLGDDGTILLNGDTGLSAGFKDALEAIKGQPRTIPLFSSVSGPGNNSMFTVVGFAGIRIMYVKLTGSMSSKAVIIQPAYVCDNTAITTSGPGPSYYVYQPVRLSR